ncbi:LysR family transcriptional regulator [Tistrella mobilis]|uniref:LysR substrate-binding domain-containing protein n=1 Tax=Tistrella mobilis TaxID=171437 RepID=UPI003558C85D
MPDISYDLRYLRYAILLAEHGSFRRTAEILSISQSTVSRRIQLLERRIGVKLFERHRWGTRPTLAGERFLKEASVGAKHLNQAVDSVAQAKRGSIGLLRIGLMACLSSGFLSELLAAYRRRFPAIEVIFEEATSQINANALLDGRLDIAFMPGDPQLPGCRAERLWEETIYIAIPAWHRTASLEAVRWEDVGHETFLLKADATRTEIEDYLIRQLCECGLNPKISVQHIGCENLLNIVGQGFGVTVVTSSVVGVVYPGVRFIPIADGKEKFSFSAAWSATNPNPALKFLVDMGIERRTKSKR